VLLSAGPTTTVTVQRPDGGRQVIGGPERHDYIDELVGIVRSFVARGPFYPGADLTDPPALPAAMPYKPYDQ
jgi:hypothetical protein